MSNQELTEKLNKAQSVENSGDFFSASFYYKEALLAARSLGDSAAIKLCKAKLVEMNQKSKDAFKEVEFEQKIPQEQIAKKSTPVAFAIASLSTISPKGHLLKGGSDPDHHWYAMMYQMTQELTYQLYLGRIMFEMIENKKLNEDELLAYFKESKIFPEDIISIMEIGIRRYFAKDYVSAIHILVPQFESLFLFVSERLGLDVIALNQTKEISTQQKTLAVSHLDSDEFKKVWGKDLCEQIKFLLFDPMGYKLRHKVAHGEITFNECNFGNTTLILYLFLALAARVKPKEEPVNPTSQ